MIITPLQSATRLTIIQAGDTRADNGRHRASDTAAAELQNAVAADSAATPETDKNAASSAGRAEKTNGRISAKGKKVDFSALSDSLKNSLQLTNISFEFSVDSQTQSIILRIVDAQTKEVLQQLPSELALKISRLIAGSLEQGQVTDAKV